MRWNLVTGAARLQVQMTRQNIEELQPLLTVPLLTLVSMSILVYSGRQDLAGYALVASLLMTVGGMAFLVSSEVVAHDREWQTLELAVASPAPYVVLLATRVVILNSLGLVGFVEGWVIVRTVFGIHVTIHHPGVFAATLVFTTLAAAGTSLITSPLFCFGRTTRTYQNAINGPLFLLGGVLVPVTFLPIWIQPLSRIVFFYWSADLLRESLQPPNPQNVLFRLGAILVLTVIAAAIGATLLSRILDHLRREGTLGLK